MKVEQAIEFARNNKSLEGVTIEDLKDTQVKAVGCFDISRKWDCDT